MAKESKSCSALINEDLPDVIQQENIITNDTSALVKMKTDNPQFQKLLSTGEFVFYEDAGFIYIKLNQM